VPAAGAAIGAGHAGPAGGTGGAATKFAHSGGAGGASAGMTGSGPNSDGAWGASADGGGAVASDVASDVAWGSAGGIAPENAYPQPMQNFCPAETSGLPQLGQNPNPVVISSLPLDSTWRLSDGGPSGLMAAPKGRTAIRSNQTTS
jgi:hypothetical protein